MRLTIIGCTGSMSGPASPASCYLIQAPGVDPQTGLERMWNVVLELGPGSFGALWRHIDPRDLDAVIFSHCHADHMGDVVSLQVHRRWGPASDLPPLLVAGPADTAERIRQIDGAAPDEQYCREFSFFTLSAEQSFMIGPLSLTPAAGWHTVEAYGVRVEGPGEEEGMASMFFTGDTDEISTIREGARGVDLLLTEVGFTRADTTRGIHMDGVRAGRLAAQAQAGRVVATHIQPWTDRGIVEEELRTHWSGPLDFADADRVFIVEGE
ncbi:MBL fold metallo-hydrolase [Actinomyces mediterranea]|uniref:MBL fold metallo-hydrolase n=1 Tax=Actinomyces mediterranea TaxID=1871028 RepID=UPI0009708E49|nr:MBL fold metallo-hydrolase [Actinomyces mediterranea]